MEEAKNNDLKLRLLIEMEQWEDGELLSEYRSDEKLHYPTLMNWQANQMSVDLNMLIKTAVSDYINALRLEKKDRNEKANEAAPRGAIR